MVFSSRTSGSGKGAGALSGVGSGGDSVAGLPLAESPLVGGVLRESPGGMFAIVLVFVGVVLSPAVGTGFFRIVAGFDAGQGVVDHFACAIFCRRWTGEPYACAVRLLCGEHRGQQKLSQPMPLSRGRLFCCLIHRPILSW